MIITDLKVHKVDPTDPRYPEAPEGQKFAAVYRCECTLEDGQKVESVAPIFVGGTGIFGEVLTPDFAKAILMSFADAVGRMQPAKAA